MSVSDIISALGLLLNLITGRKNKPKIVIKIKALNIVDEYHYRLDMDGTKVFVPKRMDIEITVINEGPRSIYIEQVEFIMQSSSPFEPNNSFSYPPSSFGLHDPLEIKERTKATFPIDREKLREEVSKNNLGEIIEQIWIKDATDNCTKLKIPEGMRHIFDFRT